MSENDSSQDDIRIYSEDKDGNLSDTLVPAQNPSDIQDQATFYKALAGDDEARKIVTDKLGVNIFK